MSIHVGKMRCSFSRANFLRVFKKTEQPSSQTRHRMGPGETSWSLRFLFQVLLVWSVWVFFLQIIADKNTASVW